MNIFLYAGFQLIQYETVHFIEEQLSADQTEISFDLDENLLVEQGVDVFEAEFCNDPEVVFYSIPDMLNSSQQVHAQYQINICFALLDIQSPPPQAST